MKNKKLLIAGLFLLLVFLFSAGKLLSIYSGYRKSAESYDALREIAAGETASASAPAAAASTASAPTAAPDPTVWRQVDFDALRALNRDVVAWIYVEGTPIDYPVVQADDNEYYLDRHFTDDGSTGGCIFLDCDNSPQFSDPHSVLYGHNMLDGSMFAELMYYKTQDFYDAHPTGQLLTPERNYHVDFFAGCIVDTAEGTWDTTLKADEISDWFAGQTERSCFASTVELRPGDRVITLSTCSYEFNDARFVLSGILY